MWKRKIANLSILIFCAFVLLIYYYIMKNYETQILIRDSFDTETSRKYTCVIASSHTFPFCYIGPETP